MAITKEMEKKSATDQKRATAVDLPNCNYHLLFPTERSYYTLLSMGWTKHRKGSTQAYPRTFGLRRRPVLSVKWLLLPLLVSSLRQVTSFVSLQSVAHRRTSLLFHHRFPSLTICCCNNCNLHALRVLSCLSSLTTHVI